MRLGYLQLAQDVARATCIGLAASGSRAVREAFRLVESRGGWRNLRRVLRRRSGHTVGWARTWVDAGVADPGCFWESAAHRAPDGRTPLTCALLASPRLALLAALRENPDVAQRLKRFAADTLAGATALHTQRPDFGGCQEANAARAAARDWRGHVLSELLAVDRETLPFVVDAAGRTALHCAAAAGDGPAATQLLGVGLCRNATDAMGRTPAHVAAVYGHARLAKELDANPRPDAAGRTVADILALQRASWCSTEHQGEMTLQALFRDYVAVGRPVLLKGGVAHLVALADGRFDRPDHVAELLQGHKVSCGVVPYVRSSMKTLDEYLSSAWPTPAARARGVPQPYVFDVAVHRQCPALLAGMELLPPEVRDPHVAYIRHPQFGLGFQGAGAPMHVHHAALNALFVGRKRWYLTPPRSALWTRQPSALWVESEECSVLRSSGDLLEVVQEAGDLIFVPEGWGHATLLESFCVGIGQEFIPNSSVSS